MTGMRLLIANANTTAAITEACAAAARAAAAPQTEIIAATPRFGAAVISTRAENAVAAHALLELLAEHAGQVEAVVLAVSHDTALEAARQLMPCPVVGMTEAACLTACMLGGRFGVVTFGGVDTYREQIARLGLATRLSGLRGLAVTPPQALADPEGVGQMVLEAVAAMVAEGADSIVLGGAGLAGFDTRLGDRAPVPLLDGIACAVRLVEGLARAGYRKPRAGSYAAPTARAVSGLSPALTRLLAGKTGD